MGKSYKEITSELNPFMKKLREEIPDVMKGFATLIFSFGISSDLPGKN